MIKSSHWRTWLVFFSVGISGVACSAGEGATSESEDVAQVEAAVSAPNDPDFTIQWHLNNTGQGVYLHDDPAAIRSAATRIVVDQPGASGRSFALVSNIGFGVGVVGVVSAVILLWPSSAAEQAKNSRLSVDVGLNETGASGTLRGAW